MFVSCEQPHSELLSVVCVSLWLQVHEEPLMLAVADMEGLLETLKVCRASPPSSCKAASCQQQATSAGTAYITIVFCAVVCWCLVN
jgi:hypothetical protein